MGHHAMSNKQKNQIIDFIIPVYNEEDAIGLFLETFGKIDLGDHITPHFLFINDGSTDRTEVVLENYAANNKNISIISFSRNFGKEAALMAGLRHSIGDAAIPIDVDLQDPIEIVPELIKKWREGYEMVLAQRESRKQDHFMKRFSAAQFYRIHNIVANIQMEENVGDFRLLDKVVVDAIKGIPETQLFMKGIFAWVGFRRTIVTYDRQPRIIGTSKFNAWRLWNFALDGITSFSTVPLRIWTYIGSFLSLTALIYSGYLLVSTLLSGSSVPGYPSLLIAILFLGGIQLIGIGVIGEYMGRIYLESKHRPLFIIRKTVNLDEKNSHKQLK